MNVLVIAYYFPPLGLSGVQRTTKFLKYLPDNGWNPVVVAPKPAGYFAYDEELGDDLTDERITVIRTRSLDPTRLTSNRSAKLPAENKRRLFAGLSQFLFVPDNKIGWYPMAMKAGSAAIESGNIHAIFATAPPYSSLLIGANLARKYDLPLIVDFRDDWIGNPRHSYATRAHLALHRAMERSVIRRATSVVTVNSYIADSIESRHRGLVGGVVVLPQGYDPADFDSQTNKRTDVCEFLYSGVFYDAQKPDTFLKAAALWLNDNPQHRRSVCFTFAGLFPQSGIELIEELKLSDVIELCGYIPHSEVCKRLQLADVLWMTIGERPGSQRVASGKLYEYLGTRKPILGLVPDGGPRADIERYSAGFVVHPDSIEDTQAMIATLFSRWQSKTLPTGTENEVAQYDRSFLARRLAGLLSDAVSQFLRTE